MDKPNLDFVSECLKDVEELQENGILTFSEELILKHLGESVLAVMQGFASRPDEFKYRALSLISTMNNRLNKHWDTFERK